MRVIYPRAFGETSDEDKRSITTMVKLCCLTLLVLCCFNTVRCASLLEEELLFECTPVQNPAFAFDGQHESLNINCVPENEKLPKKVQTYEWRTISDDIILSKGDHIKINTNTGLYEISDATAWDSGTVICNALFGNEDSMTFTHNVVVLQVPRFVMEGVIAMTDPGSGPNQCFDDPSNNAMMNELVSGYFCTNQNEECTYDITIEVAPMEGNLCLKIIRFTHSMPSSWKPSDEALDLIAIRDEIEEYFESQPKLTGKSFFDYIGEDWSEGNGDYTDTLTAKCQPGYIVFDDLFCVPCHPGTYFGVVKGERVCTLCPDGAVSSQFGLQQCEPCTGFNQANDDQTVCIDSRTRILSETSNPYATLLKKVNMTELLEGAQEVKGYFGLQGKTGLDAFLDALGLTQFQFILSSIFLGIIVLFLMYGIVSLACRVKGGGN